MSSNMLFCLRFCVPRMYLVQVYGRAGTTVSNWVATVEMSFRITACTGNIVSGITSREMNGRGHVAVMEKDRDRRLWYLTTRYHNALRSYVHKFLSRLMYCTYNDVTETRILSSIFFSLPLGDSKILKDAGALAEMVAVKGFIQRSQLQKSIYFSIDDERRYCSSSSFFKMVFEISRGSYRKCECKCIEILSARIIIF